MTIESGQNYDRISSTAELRRITTEITSNHRCEQAHTEGITLTLPQDRITVTLDQITEKLQSNYNHIAIEL